MNKRSVGRGGEQKVCQYLKRRGYRIAACNYTAAGGEVDVIAQRHGVLAFIEVKTRSGTKYGLPSEAVDHRKRQRIIRAASCYLAQTGWQGQVRFDIAEVYQGFFCRIRHMKNAFDGND